MLHCYSFFDLFETAGDDPTKFMMVLLHLVDSCWWLSVYLHCHRADCTEENLPYRRGRDPEESAGLSGEAFAGISEEEKDMRPVSSSGSPASSSSAAAVSLEHVMALVPVAAPYRIECYGSDAATGMEQVARDVYISGRIDQDPAFDTNDASATSWQRATHPS